MVYIIWGFIGCGGSCFRGLGDRFFVFRLCCGVFGREIWVLLVFSVFMFCWGVMFWERLFSCSWVGYS